MDYALVLLLTAYAGIVISILGIVIFAATLKQIGSSISATTRKALILYALSLIFAALTSLATLYSFEWTKTLYAIALVTLGSSAATAYIERRLWLWVVYILSAFFLTATIVTLLVTGLAFRLMFYVAILVAGILLLVSLEVMLVSPSPFSISIFAVSLANFAYGSIVAAGPLTRFPQYSPIALLIVSIMAPTLASVGRPRRLILDLAMVSITLGSGLPIVIASMLSNDFAIYSFVVPSMIVSLLWVLPLDFFSKEAAETKARTPKFLALTTTSMLLIGVSHFVNWAYAAEGLHLSGEDAGTLLLSVIHGVWDPYIVYTDWLLGLVAVSSFMLAALTATYSGWAIEWGIDSLLVFSSVLIVLGFPWINAGRYELELLYLPLIVFIVIAVGLMSKIMIDLRRLGRDTAAKRLLAFTVSALLASGVVLYSDRSQLIVNIIIWVLTGLILLKSVPSEAYGTLKRSFRPMVRSRGA